MTLNGVWFQGKNSEYDFKGGVGAASVNKQGVFKSVMKDSEEKSIELESDDDISDVDLKCKDMMEVTPVRHSERTAGKRFKYVPNHFHLLDLLSWCKDVTSSNYLYVAWNITI